MLVIMRQRPRARMKRLTDKLIGDKKQHHTKPYIHHLFEDKSALPDKHATVFLYSIGTRSRMPDLGAVHNIKKIIMIGPQIGETGLHQPRFHWTVEGGDQTLSTTKLPVILRMLQHPFEKIVHRLSFWVTKWSRSDKCGHSETPNIAKNLFN